MRTLPAVVILLAGLLILSVAGCGDSSKESESAIEGLAKKAEDLAETAGEMADDVMEMAPEDLKAEVEELRKEIEEKKKTAAEIADKLKALSPSEMTGDAAKKLEGESTELKKQIEDLEKKLETYMAKLTD